MQFVGFEIKKFKGIDEVEIDLVPTGANVFTLIGLNESGKTTILEAINHHSDHHMDALYGETVDKISAEELAKLVPKSRQSDFSDSVIICALLKFEDGEKQKIIKKVEDRCDVVIDPASIPDEPRLTKKYVFEDSDYKSTNNFYNFTARFRTKRAKKFKRTNSGEEPWISLTKYMREAIPEIAYFPTFLFNQPDRIYLTPHEGESDANALYRKILENIAADLPQPLDLQRHLVDRLISEETLVDGVFSLLGLTRSKNQQITAAKNEIGRHLTQTVFKSWTKTFGGDFGGREIILSLDVETDGVEEPLAYASFEIKDEGGQYEIKERSLGFRWFFSFVLFTLFGSNTSTGQKKLFLLDEPASNLHSRAQIQLLESFGRIGSNGNQIIYSTHSHYLVNPDWLDQAYIVSNMAIDYDKAYQNDNVEARTNIQAQKYKTFVGKNPDKMTYFQPVLDKLDVVPSRLDFNQRAVLVEGKGDFRIFEYLRKNAEIPSDDYVILPTRGATGMDELIGLLSGWGVRFVVCLDDDREGIQARDRYRQEWALHADQVFTLASIDPTLKGKRIEGLLEDADRQLIKEHFSVTKLKKGQIGLYFAENLASGQKVELSSVLLDRARAFDEKVKEALANLP